LRRSAERAREVEMAFGVGRIRLDCAPRVLFTVLVGLFAGVSVRLELADVDGAS
jgi:hypothetical protein